MDMRRWDSQVADKIAIACALLVDGVQRPAPGYRFRSHPQNHIRAGRCGAI
jgi:hypothetical protein